MNLNEYARRKESLIRRMLAALFLVFKQFLKPFMSARDWGNMMHVTYVVVKPFRDEGTELAREFYDANRVLQQPSKKPQDIFKDDFYPERWFRETMAPVFEDLQKTGNVDGAFTEASNRVTKVVEDGARRTILQGVVDDHDSPVRGYARFDPRPPTCAFCTMMISRGPVYIAGKGASSAGFPEGHQRLERLILDDDTDAINELMNKWHPGCTCIAVPIYKYDNYVTQEQEREAFKIYEAAVKATRKEMRAGQSKMNTRLILNEMRKLIYKPNTGEDEVMLSRNVA